MKKQLLGLMLLSGALLVSCQTNTTEVVEEVQEPAQVQETAEEREARLEQIREEKRKQDALEAKEKQPVQYTEEKMEQFFQNLYLSALMKDREFLIQTLNTYHKETGEYFEEQVNGFSKFEQWVADNKRSQCTESEQMCKDVYKEYTDYVYEQGGFYLYEQNESNFGYDEMDEFLQEELARDIQNYEDNKANGNETYLEIVSDIIGKDIEAGLTYENFLLVGTVDFNNISTINKLFGKQGELIGEQQNVQQYRWTSGSGSSYRVVQIMFVDGQVESKSQSGLK